jgi:hypothetical protein
MLKIATRRLRRWVERGYYSDLAYSLHALFPRPEGEPHMLIQEAWRYI